MIKNRAAGVLLHISSLPGMYGTGTIGKEAADFAQMLGSSGQKFWQILPIGPVSGSTGYSPYTSTSTFAGNILFISPETMCDEKYITPEELCSLEIPESNCADFNAAEKNISRLLETAHKRFTAGFDRSAYERFCTDNLFWLDDYSMFCALAEKFGTNEWLVWPEGYSKRRKESISFFKKENIERIEFHKFSQYIFFSQWNAFKKNCHKNRVELIGDIPIYISLDSADAWAHPEILELDPETGRPESIAGVPPDYFSETGQRWGNPLYAWFNKKKLKKETIEWWIKRIRHISSLVDIVRIDHFRAFESYWSIPEKEKTAINGKWVKGPGMDFFELIKKELGSLPLIAEDLGIITPEVEKLRDALAIPGMKILQFAFDGNSKNPYLPHNYSNSMCVVYTGTHDNNTTNGWFYGNETGDETRKNILEYLGAESFSDFNRKLVRTAYMSTAILAIVPVQDFLGYGQEFRMNTPGIAGGNWMWKLRRNELTFETMARYRRMLEIYGRIIQEQSV